VEGFRKDTSKKVNEAVLEGHKVLSDDSVPNKDGDENKGDETKKEEDVSPQRGSMLNSNGLKDGS